MEPLSTSSKSSKSRRLRNLTKEEEESLSQRDHKLEDAFLWHFSAKSSFCLCEAPDNPEWQFQHRQMFYGYRTCDTFWGAFLSLFYFHNEFVNIWLHYLGTAMLLWKAYTYYQQYSPHISSLPAEYQYDFYIIFVSVLMGNCYPILTSGICHHFYCVSQAIHKFCWYLDFTGMLSGITFVTANFMYLTFYCENHPTHSVDPATNLPYPHALTSPPPLISQYNTYHKILTILIGGYFIAMYLCWQKYHARLTKEELLPKDRFPEFSQTLSFYSVFTYALSIGATMYYHPEYLASSILPSILFKSCFYPLAMAMGIVVFAQGAIPERFYKQFGVSKHFFDFVGHSHQMWHVVSLVVLYFWMDVIFEHYEARYHITCSSGMMRF